MSATAPSASSGSGKEARFPQAKVEDTQSSWVKAVLGPSGCVWDAVEGLHCALAYGDFCKTSVLKRYCPSVACVAV